MSRELSSEYEYEVYKLFHLNRIEENILILRSVIERFIMFLKLKRFVVDNESGNVFSIDHKLKHLLHEVGEKKILTPMFIEWYKTAWLDYETAFKPKYDYLVLNLNIYLKHCTAHLPVIQIASNYVHFLNGLYNTDTQQFFKLTNMQIKHIYTVQKCEQNYYIND